MKHIHPDLTHAFYKRRSMNSREFKRGDGSTSVVIDVVHIRDTDPTDAGTFDYALAEHETLIIIHIPSKRFVAPTLKWALTDLLAAFEPLPIPKWKQRKRAQEN